MRRLACATSVDGVTKEPHFISPALRAECNTASAGLDKSIGLQAILKGNSANKLGGSRCADLTALPRSVPSLFNGIAQNKA